MKAENTKSVSQSITWTNVKCLTAEKITIVEGRNTNLLNTRDELVSKCRHENRKRNSSSSRIKIYFLLFAWLLMFQYFHSLS